ncbi:hypothetical protein Golob_027818 [Gossypium lobatum]|uniref:Uncharacterized protein n=1 Tax=Gossypium lobatum TaxID=34289 RepID=A0A7J8ND40_9ROSI|nr:hypothetical protein [Gossypium lobatum]
MDKHLFRALVKFWNSAYSFFTFGKVDLVPTVEEYKALLLLGHIDEAVSDLFDRLDRRVTCVPTILAETFRSLNTFWRMGEGRFIGCAQLLLDWFHSHF